MSNLLERLHASFFLYIMSTPSSFLKIGTYLPSAVLLAAALMFGGLQEWVSAGWVELEEEHPSREKGRNELVTASKKKWVPRRRDLLGAFVVTAASHLVGLALFAIISQAWFDIRLLVSSSVFVVSCHRLIFMSEFHNPAHVLDNLLARAVAVPLAWWFCAYCTTLHDFEGHQHVPCEYAYLRFVGSQFLPRRSPCGHSRRTTVLGLSIGFFTIAWPKMCILHSTCSRLACLRRRSQAGNMGLAGTRCLVFTTGLPRLRPVCTPSWHCLLPFAVTMFITQA